MKKVFLASLLVAIAALCAPVADAQSRLRGMTLSPEVTAADIVALGATGARVARYQLVFHQADTATEAEYMAWLETAITRLDSLLPAFRQAGIGIFLDLHTPPGGFVSRTTPAWHRVFAEAWAQTALVKSWQRLATKYANEPLIVGFDLCNEPAERQVAPGLKSWSDLAVDVANAVRAIDQVHPIVVQPVYGNQSLLKRLKPLPVSNVLYSFHMYFPLSFQQQGLYGRKLGVRYPNKKLDKNSLKRALNDVVKYQKKHKVEFYVGEFSAVRWAPGNSSFLYLRDVINLFERNKWHWTYHAWREADAWSIEHDGNINNKNPVNFETDRARLLKKQFARR